MNRIFHPRIACLVLVLVRAATAGDDAGLEFYEKRVRPVFVEHCYRCHAANSKRVEGGFRLDTKRRAMAGGDSGPAIVRGKPEASPLLSAVSYSGQVSDMPPQGKLPDRIIADIRHWIRLGAPMPNDVGESNNPTPQKSVDIDSGRKFWSFLPLKNVALPVSTASSRRESADERTDATTPEATAIKKQDWPQRRIDWFVLNELEERGLAPAGQADRRTLIRRVWLDLVGLPPTIDDVERFAADEAPDAFARLVDRLLASPHYGERWGRHWLDVARYAEDNPTGESTCKPPPFPWPYRDWVIRSLNADLPYDDFVRRQLAADLMTDLPPAEIAATGFLGLSPVYHKEPKLSAEVISVIVADEWDERLDTVTRGFLALTVACARCHDHKFDPIRIQDYYALAGVMASTQLVEWPLVETSAAVAEALTETREAIVDYQLRVSYAKKMRIAAEIDGQPTDAFVKLAAAHQKTLDEFQSRTLFDGPVANVVRDAGVWVNEVDPDWTNMTYRRGEPRDLPVFIRGNPNNPGDTVPRRFIEVLSPDQPQPFLRGSGRLELADAIVTDARGLTARVIVNRVWGWHFGQPLVRTPSNFGALGERPSHPELLDDLAARFVANGWSLKWLHREILLSATWQQSSVTANHRHAETLDPENRLLWKMNRNRLDPEIWRDTVLSVAGELDGRMFGKSAKLDDDANRRRTVYGVVSRQRPAKVLQLFDFPDAKRHADQRILTTTPLQQLYLLNGPLVAARAESLAAACPENEADTVKQLFRTVLLREPSTGELAAAGQLLRRASSREVGRQLLAQSLLASSEFLFVD